MTYMILWRAWDKSSLFESEEYETYPEASAALGEFHARFRWNTYLLVKIEKSELGVGDPPRPQITIGESAGTGAFVQITESKQENET